MNQWCTLLWALITGAAAAASVAVSWLLENVPEFRRLWDRLSSGAKRISYALITLLIGLGAYALGRYAIGCAFDGWLDILYIVILAAIGWLSGGFRYERASRKRAEKYLGWRK